MSIALNGEYKTLLNDNESESEQKEEDKARLFVVYRDGNGYELLSNDTVCKFREYLKKYEPTPQILAPKALLSTTDDSPLSHRFIMERFANNAPRQQLNIPSILCETLKTKLNTYKDDEINRNCSIYRHILETPIISKEDIQSAQNDLLNFTKWVQENENVAKLENNNELNEINNKMVEQRNKLKQETDLSPLELKLTLTSELERSKLNALNQELQKKEESEEMKEINNEETIKKEIENKENKENAAKAREIRNIQQENEQNAAIKTQNENVGYFANEPFLRDYEINQNLLEIFSYFIKIWTECDQTIEIITNHDEDIDAVFIDTLSVLKILGKRLREIISVKTLKGNLKTLLLNEEVMMKITANEFIANHIDNLLRCIGFVLSDDGGYIPQQSNIFIDAGICNMLSKLDEFHAKFKQYLFKINNNNTGYIKSFEMDLKTKIIDDIDGTNSFEEIHNFKAKKAKNKPRKIRKPYSNHNDHGHAIDTPYFPSSPSYSIVTEYENVVGDKPDIARCLSHCTCCPIDSPLRATRMDYLGRDRNHIISMDDLEKYPKAVSDKQLNTKYIETEGTVQRRVRTSSTFNKSLILKDGFPTVVIQPNIIDFGNILIGNVYRFTATITNHGNSQARFKIDILDDDKDEDNKNVVIKPYYRSGGIAPGITITLEIEFYSQDFIGQYTNTLTIKTQKHIFNVDITANVMQNDNDIDQLIDDRLMDTMNNNNNNNNKKSRVTCLGKKY